MNDALIHIHQIALSKNLPFVTFRLPQQEHPVTYLQTTPGNVQWNTIEEISAQKGFIMAPFDNRNGKKYLLIRPDLVFEGTVLTSKEVEQVQNLPTRPAPGWNGAYPVVTGKGPYMEQVKAIKSSISTGAFQKAVLSRIEAVEGEYLNNIPRLFSAMCRRHPNAFVYLFKSDSEFWMGASPEPLLRIREKNISTVSLAGTRPYAEKHMDVNRWTVKEILEQEYVTRYIHDVLHAFQVRDYRVTSPYVKKAGNLVHLRTDFSFDINRISGRLWEFVDAMHPTPAVAGQPKEEAIRFIKALEPHDRDYYTGFLGPVGLDNQIDLFVNLRCFRITPRYLSLYVGGGITLDSDPEAEWDETGWKAESLMKVIGPYLRLQKPRYEAKPTHR